jgi:predicted PhzF superfamily epimerase YddE/YHI9
LRGERDLTLQLRIAQGVDMGRPSLLEATAEKRNGRITGMWIGGKCVAMMRVVSNYIDCVFGISGPRWAILYQAQQVV